MAGDLEDFLRRAAQRRQQKAQQQKQQQAAAAASRREPPQYSDRRSERVTRPVELDEPVLTAEIIEDDAASRIAAMRRLEDAEHASKLAAQKATRESKRSKASGAKSQNAASRIAANPAEELIRLLRQPGGIQQAILLREILDRPEHRW
jgi:hypothetical protein